MSELFREYLDAMSQAGKLETITDEVDKRYEVGRLLEDFDNSKIVKFTNVRGSIFPLLGNVCASREMLAMSMGINLEDLHTHLLGALTSPSEPKIVDAAPFLENKTENVDFDTQPIPRFFKEDAGNYFTSGLIITKGVDPEIHNSSIHRQLVVSKNETTARIVPRHLYHNIKEAEKRDEDLPIAIAFGLHPGVILAASTPTSIQLDEMNVANTMLNQKLERVRLQIGRAHV